MNKKLIGSDDRHEAAYHKEADEWADRGCLPECEADGDPLLLLEAKLQILQNQPEKLKQYTDAVASRVKIAAMNGYVDPAFCKHVLKRLGVDSVSVEKSIGEIHRKLKQALQN